MEIAMAMLEEKGPEPRPPAPAAPAMPKAAMSRGTTAILEKLEAGKEILQMMEDQQRQNLEYARMFAELAKSVGWPQSN